MAWHVISLSVRLYMTLDQINNATYFATLTLLLWYHHKFCLLISGNNNPIIIVISISQAYIIFVVLLHSYRFCYHCKTESYMCIQAIRVFILTIGIFVMSFPELLPAFCILFPRRLLNSKWEKYNMISCKYNGDLMAFLLLLLFFKYFIWWWTKSDGLTHDI